MRLDVYLNNDNYYYSNLQANCVGSLFYCCFRRTVLIIIVIIIIIVAI